MTGFPGRFLTARGGISTVLVLLFGALAWLHLAAPISMVTADLGRHIRNGEQFVTARHILSTNFYSYTFPDFPALCHHWGIGVIFYGLWKAWGFAGLSWFYTGVLFSALLVALWQARRASFFGAALLAGLLALPLAGTRTEIRPEGVSMLFLALEFLVLDVYQGGRLRRGWLCVLPFLHAAWVNIHILFMCGLLLIACYLAASLVRDPRGEQARSLAVIFCAAVAASLINPFIFGGTFDLAALFQGYGYKLAENQNVFFMIRRFPEQPVYGYYLAAVLVTDLLLGARFWKERDFGALLPHLLVWFFFGALGLGMVRLIAMAGFVFIPVAAAALGVLCGKSRPWRQAVLGAAAGLVFLAAIVPSFYLSPLRRFHATVPEPYRNSLFTVLFHPEAWGGLAPGVERSATFFRQAGLKGPVFNNYDIGGYFIFYLFPGERPFVDNRPEAYPEDFFRTVYGPMQRDEELWERTRRQYGFELIYYFRHDMTEWGQPFLIRRLADPAWAPVYVDGYTIILARRGGVNQRAIDQFELPRSMFRVQGDAT